MDQFRHLTSQCTFPWLLANVLDPALGEDVPMGNAKKTAMLTSSNGIKIGVIGIVEREWLDTINSLPPNLKFLPAAQVVQDLGKELRQQGAEMIVALTHQREPNDIKLAKEVPQGTIDLMLGGHDHFYAHSIINGVHLLRSGTDFKQLSYLECWRKPDGASGWDMSITRRDITRDIPEDSKTVSLVNDMTSALRSKLERPIGYTAAPLDARFTTVRLKESNYGNFVCDLMRCYYNADCCLMAGGTIRGDQVYPPGVLRMKDIMNCFPFEDPCVVLVIKGKGIWDALENSVSTYPALEGRFPQVSNIKFTFDPNKDPNHRVLKVEIAGEPLKDDKDYTLVTRGYMAHGKDGYHSLLMASEGGPCQEVVSEENGMLISALLRQYFMSLRVLGRWKRWGASMSRHWGNVHDDLHEKHPVRQNVVASPELKAHIPEKDSHVEEGRHEEVQHRKKQEASSTIDGRGAAAHGASQHQGSDLVSNALKQPPSKRQRLNPPNEPIADSTATASDSEDEENQSGAADLPAVAPHEISHDDRIKILVRRMCRKWWRLAGLKGHPGMVEEEGEDEWGKGMCMWTKGIAPRVEGRIVMVES